MEPSVSTLHAERRQLVCLDSQILHPKISHQVFGHMHEVLNKIYLQNFFARMGCKSRDESNELN